MVDQPIEIDCSDDLHKDLEQHCFSEKRVEVGGFLLGKIEGSKTIVTRVMPAKHTVSKSTQLTFTHKTWDVILDEIKKSKTEEILVGWYHSHPNFGIFLSDHDQFIQNNFFKEDGKITIVIDPIRGRKGWFFSQDGKIISLPEEDTKKEKLGASAVNADENMLEKAAPKQYVTVPALLITSLIFAVISFGLGILVTSSQMNSKIDTRALALIQNILQQQAFLNGQGAEVIPTPTSTPTGSTTSKARASSAPSTKAPSKAKKSPAASPSTRATPTLTPTTSPSPTTQGANGTPSPVIPPVIPSTPTSSNN